jgi:hypothetical protein
VESIPSPYHTHRQPSIMIKVQRVEKSPSQRPSSNLMRMLSRMKEQNISHDRLFMPIDSKESFINLMPE